MYQLLSSLAPTNDEDNKQEESQSEDEDADRLVERRTSINIDNVIGLDFEHYNKIKPSQQIRLKIVNCVQEYLQAGDLDVASEDFADICQRTETKPFIAAGYMLIFGFSQDLNNWNRISKLVVDQLHLKDTRISAQDLVER